MSVCMRTKPPKHLPNQQEIRNFLEVLGKTGVAIRSSPAYPGERTGEAVRPGEVHEFKARVVVQHKQHNIYFYELADGRGYVV